MDSVSSASNAYSSAALLQSANVSLLKKAMDGQSDQLSVLLQGAAQPQASHPYLGASFDLRV